MALGDVTEFPFPIIADPNREISTLLGMLRPEEKDKEKMPLSVRKMFLIGPDGKLKLASIYPAIVGRSFE
jgi:alkyl hydroperoxide reductase subunit AhpC